MPPPLADGSGELRICGVCGDGFVNGSFLRIRRKHYPFVKTSNLSANTQYFVVFTSGNIKDTAGNAYAGISTYDFKTVNIINGTANNDTLTGTVSADTINGLAGNDVITGGAGTDSMNGGERSDL